MKQVDIKTLITEAGRAKKPVPFIGTEEEYLRSYESHSALNLHLSMDNADPADWNRVLLQTESLGALRSADLPSRENMLLPFFRQGDAMLLYAPAGVGKSFLSMCIGLAVAGGGSIKGLDWSSEVKHRVLLVDGEMPREDLRDRVNMIVESKWIDGLDTGSADANFTLLARLGQHETAGFIDLTQDASHKLIGGYCVNNGVKLVILDNFSTLTDSMEEENNATAFRQLNLFVSKLKRRGISVLLIHHANKEASSFRGSSALAVPYDSIVGMHKLQNQPDNGVGFRLAFEKLRASPSQATQTREITMTPFGYSTAEGLSADSILQTVVNQVNGHAGAKLSFAGAAKAWDLVRGTLCKKLTKALDNGLLDVEQVERVFNGVPPEVKDAMDRANPEF